MSENLVNRRGFLSSIGLAGTAGMVSPGILLSSCGNGRANALTPLIPEAEWNIPTSLPDTAGDGVPLKAGLIGCGARGKGSVHNLLTAATGVTLAAIGDVFQDSIDDTRKALKEVFNQELPDDKCFTGFDSYRKVIDAGVDIVLLATPPNFRPLHFKAAVEAGKHVFLEKPMAVDVAGALSVIATSRQAVAKGLAVITGTQRHHERSYIEGYKQVQSGLIGDIVSANVCWNTGSHWFRNKDAKWTDMEGMLRDWGNWTWLSGDHIVEQHIHNIDVFNWFSGKKPLSATGVGARQRRSTGDQYDMFSVDFAYEEDVHVHSLCRQIDGCANNVFEVIRGTKGTWSSDGVIKDRKANVVWKYDAEREKAEYKQTNPYVLEHVNWINHIRNNKTICQAEETAVSTLTAIIGRMSAYSGKEVTWDEAVASGLNLQPETLSLTDLDLSKYPVPVPGTPSGRANNQR
ncbi:putative oxidoreductase yvaA [Bacteroidales bacterium Barb6XT]|nr:putative oxidoreductase yvaA [Bacteroidales bacterium Barb6XT]